MKILYVGPLFPGSTCLQRMQALAHLGHRVFPVDTCPPGVSLQEKRFWERAWRKILGPQDLAQVNRQILESARKEQPQVLWVDKGLTIKPQTLEAAKEMAPGLVRVSYSPDDMANPKNQSRRYLAGIPLYDLHVTTKSYNVPELTEMGAPRVLFVDNAFCPFTHRPMNLTPADKKRFGCQVGFIGNFEEDRAKTMAFLAENGIPVKVWGDWPLRWRNRHPNLMVMGVSVWGDDYSRAICATEINLAFLSKQNRDLQTTRSLEIPACGGFMLAERTEEHLRLFHDGTEAVFFGSREEMLEKVKYFLEHTEERRRIASAGRKKCLTHGYSNSDRLKGIMNLVEKELLH